MNNADKLREIDDIEVPDDLCCPITGEIMTDPVFNEQNPKRFERAAILLWLKQSTKHPYNTELLLSPDHLKRDFTVKLKADQFVDNIFVKQKTTLTNKPLTKLSVFQPYFQCLEEEDDDITDQMMAESAFGRGSNTYKNRC